MNVCIYSVNLGAYDHFHGCPELTRAWERCYITDAELTPWQGWGRIRRIPPPPGDLKRAACQLKIASHQLPDHEISVYLDASVRLRRPLDELVARFALSGAQVQMFAHPRRGCTYAEARVCIDLGLDEPERIHAQMGRYRREGFPEGYGLAATALILRRNTPAVRVFNARWLAAYSEGARRDQLSVMYASWRAGLPIGWVPGSVYRNPWIRVGRHRRGTARTPNPTPTPDAS